MSAYNSDITSDPQNVASEKLQGRHEDGDLVSWVMSRVVRWRTTRDSNYFDLWDQYWALWRGQWNAKLKQRDSERSRLIAPATQQAVDATVSEMVEATFGRGDWFDIREEIDDPKVRAVSEQARDQLLKDFTRDRVQHAVQETYLNGAIYGTGISKRVIYTKNVTTTTQDAYGNPQDKDEEVTCVGWQALPPYNFVIDTAALTIEDALGCAHETIRPISEIEDKITNGEYKNVAIGSASGYATGIIARGPKGENLEVNILDGTYITEYHGKVPSKYFDETDDQADNPLVEFSLQDGDQEGDKKDPPESMAEAIIVIANGNALLKKAKNPFPGGDRGFVAYQHDRVPNRFWGRGVCEKAFNSQLALDAELRARIDAMAINAYPMVGFDATRLPRNLNLQVRPGKAFLTNGDPEQIIRPINFDNMNPQWFSHSQDLERMVGLATGTFDTGQAVNTPAGNTASGASMSQSAMIKRAKLTMQTVDIDYLDPLVTKSYLAYQVLEPKKYPPNQKFDVNSSMSIMAREYEQTQMTNLLAIIPPESPAHMLVLRAIVENYSGPSRGMLVGAIEKMMQPDPQQQQQQQQKAQIQMQGAMAEVKKLEAEVQRLQSEAQLNAAKVQTEQVSAQYEGRKVEVQEAQTMLEAKKLNQADHVAKIGLIHDTVSHMNDVHQRRQDHFHANEDRKVAREKIEADKAKAAAAAAKAKSAPKP